MRRTGPGPVVALSLLSLIPALALGREEEGKGKQKQPKNALDFKVKDIDGKPVDLKKHLGKVVLVVNVASR